VREQFDNCGQQHVARQTHAKLADATAYVHLSGRQLRAVPSPLEAIDVSSPEEVKRSRRLIKR
jgi:hypothetical protein